MRRPIRSAEALRIGEKGRGVGSVYLSSDLQTALLPGLETWGIGIIPKHLLEKEDINTTSFNRKPIGTGPFRFVEWVSDEKIVVEANPRYFEGRPNLDGIIYRIIPETALNEMEILTRRGRLFRRFPLSVPSNESGPFP